MSLPATPRGFSASSAPNSFGNLLGPRNWLSRSPSVLGERPFCVWTSRTGRRSRHRARPPPTGTPPGAKASRRGHNQSGLPSRVKFLRLGLTTLPRCLAVCRLTARRPAAPGPLRPPGTAVPADPRGLYPSRRDRPAMLKGRRAAVDFEACPGRCRRPRSANGANGIMGRRNPSKRRQTIAAASKAGGHFVAQFLPRR